MISRPTTDRLVLDCCAELRESFLPDLTDETKQVQLVMIETVLQNVAVRAAHEIAWMREETAAMQAYAAAVADRCATAELTAALANLAAGPWDSLHLADVDEVYVLAGTAFAAAVDAAGAAGAQDLLAGGRAILDDRMRREKDVMSTYGIVGR